MPNRVIWGAVALALAPFVLAQDGAAQAAGAASVAPTRSRAAFASRSASRGGAESTEAARPGRAAQPTRVYLLRGLWNVWSYGMDDLANKLRGVGVEAVVVNHTMW